jgi:hypothetical protein
VQWVHPTWRDLVIRRLRDDPRARRHFLSHSGVYGTALALSTAGGAAGGQRLPLVGSDEDWDVLTDRVCGLVSELEPAELIALFSALSEALVELRDSPRARQEAQAAARTALARTAVLWDAAHTPIPLAALEAWLALGRTLRPRPELPELSVTWVELLPTHAPALDDLVEMERFNDWLALCEMLVRYDAALSSERREHRDVMAEFLDRVDLRRLEQCPEPLAPTELEPVLRALDSIASLAPELSLSAENLARVLRRARTTDAPGPTTSEQPSYVGEAFEVRRVLADL